MNYLPFIFVVSLVAKVSRIFAAEPQTVDFISVNPTAIDVNHPTTVTAFARVGVTATLIPASVTLLKYDPSTKAFVSIGRMYDDGTHGDATPGDNLFTSTFTASESTVQQLKLKVSVANRGVVKKTFSNEVLLSVRAASTPEAVLAAISGYLKSGDIEKALVYFSQSPRHRTLLSSLTPEVRLRMSEAFAKAKLISSGANSRKYEVEWKDDDGNPILLHFNMSKTELNQWFIMAW